MPPRRNPRCFNTQATGTPPPLPPPQFDAAILQAAVTATVSAAMERYNTTVTNETSDGVITHNHVHLKECSYKEFRNCKPKAFDGTEGVLTMRQ